MTTVIGTLATKLIADSRDYQTKLNSATSLADKFGKGVKTAGKIAAGALVGVASAAIGAAAGMGALLLKTAAAADEMVESAEKIGITTTKYQEFQYIGNQIG